MRVIVEVTAEHIRNGKPKDNMGCPLYWAIYPLVREKFFVGSWLIFKVGIDVKLPANAKYFVYLFDRGCSVKPFSFSIDLPADYLRPEIVREAVHNVSLKARAERMTRDYLADKGIVLGK